LTRAKAELQMLNEYLTQNENKLKSNIFHELSHYQDALIYDVEEDLETRNKRLNIKIDNIKNKLSKIDDDTIDKIMDDVYYNSPTEYNAYFLDSLYKYYQ
jgi:hypothetical protein